MVTNRLLVGYTLHCYFSEVGVSCILFKRVKWLIAPKIVNFVVERLESVHHQVSSNSVVGDVEDIEFIISSIEVLLDVETN